MAGQYLRGFPTLAVLCWPTAVFATTIGIHDAFWSSDVGTRYVGLILAIVGVVGILCPIAALRSGAAWNIIALAGAIGVGLVGLSTLALQVAAFNVNVLAAAWLAMAMSGAVATILLFRRGTRIPAGVKWTTAATTLVLGAAQFIYTTQYIPSRTYPSASMTVRASLEGESNQSGERGGAKRAVAADVVLENVTDTRIRILGSSLVVYGISAPTRHLSEPEWMNEVQRGIEAQGIVSLPSRQRFSSTPLAVASFIYRGQFIEAHSKFDARIIMYIPAGFDAIAIRARIVVARGDRLNIQLPAAPSRAFEGSLGDLLPDIAARSGNHEPTPTARVVLTDLTVREYGWLPAMTRGKHVVRVIDVIRAPGVGMTPTVFAAVLANKDATRNPNLTEGSTKHSDLYGIANFESFSMLSLWEMKPSK